MSESQFEKMCKALSRAERERDLSRHTVEVQDGIINELRDEVERLRGLLKGVLLSPIPEMDTAEKDTQIKQQETEIKRLRELVEAGKEDRKAIDELVDEIERLRELLRKCQPYIVGTLSCGRTEACELFREIEKEVGDG